jgi:hypothetical protein
MGHFARLDIDQGIGGFEKEKRWFTTCVSHLFRVLFVISTHTVNAVHWKEGGAVCDVS